jgi:hypothetical protein
VEEIGSAIAEDNALAKSRQSVATQHRQSD